MRLINAHNLEMREFLDSTPTYAILSHRWTSDEITYKDFLKRRNTHSAGFRKVLDFCKFVQSIDSPVTTDWVWIDTCCIDKTSSSELSEAINSMFRWYRSAQECIVYLEDVTSLEDLPSSVWFTRGWTLQELIAPRYGVLFVDSKWVPIGHTCRHTDREAPMSRCEAFAPCLGGKVSDITGIPRKYLTAFQPSRIYGLPSIAERMRWAAKRQTTRVEDLAYCLLGIFNINMSLLYGEGEKAFFRLQQEIIESSMDQSIFAWRMKETAGPMLAWPLGILARAPSWFEDAERIFFRREQLSVVRPYAVTNAGVEFRTALEELVQFKNSYVLTLNCKQKMSPNDERSEEKPVEIVLLMWPNQNAAGPPNLFVRGIVPFGAALTNAQRNPVKENTIYVCSHEEHTLTNWGIS